MPRSQIPILMWGGHFARHRKRPYLATNFTLAELAAESELPAMESAKRSFHHTKHPTNTAQDLASAALQC